MSCIGFNFVEDTFKSVAVLTNSENAAERLGYREVSEVKIAELVVYHDGVEAWRCEVQEGTYRSAIWVEAMLAYRGKSRYEADYLQIDDVAVMAIRGYMGERILALATDPATKVCGFTRAIITPNTADIRVDVTWK